MKKNIGAVAVAILMGISVAACDSGPSKADAEKAFKAAVEQQAGALAMTGAKLKLDAFSVDSIKATKGAEGVYTVKYTAKTTGTAFGQTMSDASTDEFQMKKIGDKWEIVN